ncbi:hypothetical protein [Spiroplasma endosymbiont of Colias croceus]|uniref:hypothetical protein n=1 Tax=Spiroplasma endosymbiont of Colias croceus TaxID=3066310 RepID=UPI0030CAE4A9
MTFFGRWIVLSVTSMITVLSLKLLFNSDFCPSSCWKSGCFIKVLRLLCNLCIFVLQSTSLD